MRGILAAKQRHRGNDLPLNWQKGFGRDNWLRQALILLEYPDPPFPLFFVVLPGKLVSGSTRTFRFGYGDSHPEKEELQGFAAAGG